MTTIFKFAGRSTVLASLIGLSLLVTGCAASKEMMDKGKMMMDGDAAITEGVKSALAESADVDADAIMVETKDGEVMLSGTVADKKAKKRAMQITNSVDGVQQIDNMLKIAK